MPEFFNDDDFTSYAKDHQAQKNAQKSGGGGGGFTPYDWCALPEKEFHVIRALGGRPNAAGPYNARVRRISRILDDRRRQMQIVFPEEALISQYPLWKLIEHMLAPDWVQEYLPDGTAKPKKTKIFKYEQKFPNEFRIVAHNGHPAGSKQEQADKGWRGQERLIMNCIDRLDMAFHRKAKKSKLLSKGITGQSEVNGQTVTYYDYGVPSWGFLDILTEAIFPTYKDWRRYDLGIKRTGQMSPAFRIINASKYIEELPEHLQKYVVTGDLTEEEQSWTMYDLDKTFAPTPNYKILERLGNTIKGIDLKLGTNFYGEIEELAKAERAKLATEGKAEDTDGDTGGNSGAPENSYQSAPQAQAQAPAPQAQPAPQPAVTEQAQPAQVTRQRPSSTVVTGPDAVRNFLKSRGAQGADLLTDWELGEFNLGAMQAVPEGTALAQTVKYDAKYKEVYTCEHCPVSAPMEFKHCPGCGGKF